VTAIRQPGSADTGDLVRASRVGVLDPEREMVLRADNHLALQAFYAVRVRGPPRRAWLVPHLTREVSPEGNRAAGFVGAARPPR